MDNEPLRHPHDKFFKETFSRKEVVCSFIQQYLDPNDASLITINVLEPIKDSHIDTDLREIFSDSVYRSTMPNSGNAVYLLFEHKSVPDHTIGIQLLENIYMILQYHIRQHGKNGIPPTIIAVVVDQSSSRQVIPPIPSESIKPFSCLGSFSGPQNSLF